MIILGIDPGVARVGWGLIEKRQGKIFPIKFGCIETSKDKAHPERLFSIYKALSDIIEDEQPDAVAVEKLFFFKNQKTIIAVSEARGVILICAELMKVPIYEYTPLEVKQALTGYGRAEKNQVQDMVKAVCKLKECPKPDDTADALAVAICHSQTNVKLK